MRRLAADGRSDAEISEALNGALSLVAVGAARRRWRIPPGRGRSGHVPARYVTPDDIDEAAVERLMRGDRTIPLYRRGRGTPLGCDVLEAIYRLARQGLSDPEISDRLHDRLSAAAVLKARIRHEIASGRRLLAGVA